MSSVFKREVFSRLSSQRENNFKGINGLRIVFWAFLISDPRQGVRAIETAQGRHQGGSQVKDTRVYIFASWLAFFSLLFSFPRRGRKMEVNLGGEVLRQPMTWRGNFFRTCNTLTEFSWGGIGKSRSCWDGSTQSPRLNGQYHGKGKYTRNKHQTELLSVFTWKRTLPAFRQTPQKNRVPSSPRFNAPNFDN